VHKYAGTAVDKIELNIFTLANLSRQERPPRNSFSWAKCCWFALKLLFVIVPLVLLGFMLLDMFYLSKLNWGIAATLTALSLLGVVQGLFLLSM